MLANLELSWLAALQELLDGPDRRAVDERVATHEHDAGRGLNRREFMRWTNAPMFPALCALLS